MLRSKLITFIFLILYSVHLSYCKTVYIIHYDYNYAPFFDPHSARDETSRLFYELREALLRAGYEVTFTETAQNLTDIAGIISFKCPTEELRRALQQYPRDKCFFFTFEPPVVVQQPYDPQLKNCFGKIFVMFDELVDNKNYFKLYYPQPHLKMLDHIPAFNHKKLCVMICGNKESSHPHSIYAERGRAISFFEKKPCGEFELYGQPAWRSPTYKGAVSGKWDVLKKYKFSICYENMNRQKGYITEKIFDCFRAGCVPIYWGADNITTYVPASCFIDLRKFQSYEELYRYLTTMTAQKYETYLTNIRAFLASPAAEKFSIAYFIDMVLTALETP